MKNIKANYLLYLALLFAFIIRFAKLDFQSLWLDEIYTMNMADPMNSIADIYKLSQTTDALSLLYFILLNTIFKVVGFTSIVARFFSVAFGVAAIYFIYLLGKEIRNKQTGLIAAGLLCVNYFHLYYSQEARVYSMYMAFTCLSFLHLIKFLKNPTNKTASYYGIFSLLMLLSHFFALFVLASQSMLVLLWCLYKKPDVKKIIFKGFISAGIVIVGFLPVVPIFITLTKVSSTWISPLTNKVFADVYASFFGDSFLVVSFSIIVLMFLLFKAFDSESKDSENKNDLTEQLLFLLPWILVCFFIPYLKSFLSFPILQGRYLISIVPAIIIMLAIGFDLIKSNALKYGLVVLFILISFTEIWIVKHYYKNRVKSDFRGAAEFVKNNNSANSLIVSSLPYHFNYYFNSFKSKFELEGLNTETKLLQMMNDSNQKRSFWAIDAHGRNFELSESSKTYLDKNFEEVLSFQSLDAWAKYFVVKKPFDTANIYLRLNATNFFEISKTEGDKHMYLYGNGSLKSKSIELAVGNYKLVVKAISDPCFENKADNAHLNFYMNDEKKASYFLTSNSAIVGDTLSFGISNKQSVIFKIEFDNDLSTKKYDRNLVIRELLLFKNE